MDGKHYQGNVLQNPKYKKQDKFDSAQTIGAIDTSVESAAHNDRLNRFAASQGQGYAGEQANDLIDTIHGKDAKILGDDNAKNGADRMVDGQLIQTKYCQNARASVDAAFRNGEYRYIDNNGKPMQLEVPKDQYEQAVEIMRKRIAEGKVPGVTDPNVAKNLVRKGNIDYKTACNIAKAGNIDSLMFDAAHGVVIAASAFGISTLITFAKAVWDGEPTDKAIDIAMYNGLKIGGVAFATSVISAQLTRTSLNNVLMGPSIEVVKLLPSSVRQAMVNAMRSGAAIYGGAATNNLAKLVRGNIITGTVVILVLSAEDITECFKGRISGKQLFKNISTLAIGVGSGYAGSAAGGIAGGAVGTLILGPGTGTVIGTKVGSVVGAIAGGAAGGKAGHAVMNEFIEDDAVEMVRIINNRLIPLAQNYLLNKEELDIVVDELKIALEKEKLLQMFVSKDRNKFADEMLTETIEKIIGWRCRIMLPSVNEFIKGIGRVLELSNDKTALEAHLAKPKISAVEIGKDLLGKKLSEHAANKAFYVTKQMNMTLMQQELCLRNMKAGEQDFAVRKRQKDAEIAAYEKELNILLQ